MHVKTIFAFVLLAGGLSLPFVISGCGACTKMGCIPGVTFQFDRAWEDGDYLLAIDADGKTFSCEGSLPLEDRQRIDCLEEDGNGASSGFMNDFDPERGTLRVSHAAKRIRLEIFHEGQSIFAQTFQPKYERYHPNGEACDGPNGGCNVATITFPADG